MYYSCSPHKQCPNSFTSPHLYSCLIQMNHIRKHNFCLRMKCYTFSVPCLSMLHLYPSGLFPSSISLLFGKPLRINTTRSSFKSFFFSPLLFGPIRTKSFCLLIYHFLISFRDHLCSLTHCILRAPRLTVGIHQQSGYTCDSMFAWYAYVLTCTFNISAKILPL